MRMLRRSLPAALLALSILAGSCSRDTEKAKRRYVDNGNRYLQQGKVREAIIMYRNALKRDPRYGEAWLKLGDAEMRRGMPAQAVAAYRRAVELYANPEEPASKLADIFLAAYVLSPKKDPALLKEVEELASALAAKNPNSYQALRLRAFLHLADPNDRTQEHLFRAIEYFRKADAAKPKQPELRLAMVQTLAQTGQFDEAEKIAREMISDTPQATGAYWFLSRLYLQQNRLKEADAVVDRLVENNASSPGFRVDRAEYLFATQRKDAALAELDALAASQAADASLLKRIGETYLRFREPKKAEELFIRAMQRFPDQKTEFRLRMIPALLAMQRKEDAIRLGEATVKEDPNSNAALSMRASLWLNFGTKEQFEAAVKDLQQLIAKEPGNAVIRYNLGRAYQARGELDAARTQYAEAVKISRYLTAAHLGLGLVALAKGDHGKAVSEADEILSYDPTSLSARVLRINGLLAGGNTNQARIDINTYLKDTPDNADLRYLLAMTNFMDRRYQEAEAQLRALQKQFPNDLRLLFAVAEVMMRTNRQADALRTVQEVYRQNPSNPALKLALATSAMRVNQLDQAEQLLRELLAANAESTDLAMRLGDVLRRKGQIPAALDVLKQAHAKNPSHSGLALQLALTHEAAGDWRSAVPLYEAILRQDPNHLIALNNLAYRYADMGKDLDTALTYAQRAQQRAPTNEDIIDTLAWVYIRKNLNDTAISLLRPLVTKQPRNPLYHYHLGLALLQKGDRTAARQSLQTALSLNPSKEDEQKIREALAKAG
ncbi:MAG: tetratricopeptide repeat protein [Bryobacteraceae bacterium]|nr:tetratricopeptide repeat protein [Bryobacteraceae bacterium]MCX7605589.1 tetratricopeptide repeat protein [Bryobacteraceae bacterium]